MESGVQSPCTRPDQTRLGVMYKNSEFGKVISSALPQTTHGTRPHSGSQSGQRTVKETGLGPEMPREFYLSGGERERGFTEVPPWDGLAFLREIM